MTDPAPADDVALMLRVRDGNDLDAFEALYARHAAGLVNFFHRLCWDREAAEDLLQETFMRLWRSAHRYQPVAKFRTYLFQIGKNLWLNEAQRARRAPRAVGDALEAVVDAAPTQGPREEPLDALLRGETAAQVARAVSALPEPYRLVFVLGACQELPYREVSEILGIPEGTVKSRMFKACQALRESLGSRHAGIPGGAR